MSRPSLRQLEYLVALAETLHFRKAATRVGVTQPTLSGQLMELEAKLGVALIERTRQSVRPTPIGADIIRRARRILHEVKDLELAAARAESNLGGTIALGVPPTLGPYLLPHVIPALRARFPALRLYVREDRPHTLERGLEDGDFDLLMTALPEEDTHFETRPLFREALLIGLPRGHPLAGVPAVDPSKLRGEAVLALGLGHRLYDQVRLFSERVGARLLSDYEGTSLDTLRQMVAMNLGLSFFPALYVRSEMRDEEEVVVRPVAGDGLSRVMGFMWRTESPRGADFAELCYVVAEATAGRFSDLVDMLHPL